MIRALAYKWQRVLFACWQQRMPCDEKRYLDRLRITGSPLATIIDHPQVIT